MPSRLIACVMLALLGLHVHAGDRMVAITMDDLPYQRSKSLADAEQLTGRLLAQIRAHQTPVVGFVNEKKIHEGGVGEVKARTALLERWLAAGVELANHTYSHPDINETDVATYKQDILRGEVITRKLMRERGLSLRYFRHPYLRTGQTAAIKQDVERFLSEHGYTIAPVTIDNDEWIFAAAYDRAAAAEDEAAMHRIGRDYVTYMDQAFEFSEHLAAQVFQREIPQVLLIHSNALNAEYYDELVTMMKKREYSFISLEKALNDVAYARRDEYLGARGVSWLIRWAGKQLDLSKAPQVPAYVVEWSRSK